MINPYSLNNILVNFNYELIIAFLALVISFISIILTVQTIRLQKIHNKLSVRPIPEIKLSKFGGIKIKLKNVGLGPLICKELITRNQDGIVKDHIKDFIPPELLLNGKLYTNRWNFTLLPSESVTLIFIERENDNPRQIEALKLAMKALSELTIELKYESMYEELQPLYRKNLVWFKE